MPPIKLLYSVYALDNKMLLPAGTVLSAETLESLVSLERRPSDPIFPLLRYDTVREDLLQLLSRPPYSTIVDSRERLAELMALMEPIHLILPVLQSLQHFKRVDFETYRHILMVSSLATLLVKDLLSDLPDQPQQAATGPTHDFGKLCIPLDVLKKSSPLTRTERGIIEHHAAAGYALLIYYLRDIHHLSARVSRDHHERRDGSGYPRGIHLADRIVEIVAVSDVYDALISSRPYRPSPFNNRTALEEITGMAERNEIGWDVVKGLIARNRASKPHYTECSLSREKRGRPPADSLYGVITEENSDKKNP